MSTTSPPPLPPVAVIGLGQMGLRMAANLVRAGFPTHGADVNAGARQAAADLGVRLAPRATDLPGLARFIVLSLPTEAVLEQVMLAPDGLAAASLKGVTFIDTTTTTPALAQRLAAHVATRGGYFLDAPVTGGPGGAEEARLTFMIGGEAAAVAHARPVFDALGTTIVHVGPSGHGQVAKMVNQMLMAAIFTSVAEAFAFATQCGADVAQVYAAVEQGGAQSRMLTAIKPGLLAGQIGTGGYLAQHGKDIDYVIAEATRRKIPLPLTSGVHEFFQLARAMGFSDIRCQDMWAVWEKLLGIDFTATIRSTAPAAPPAA